MARIRRSHRRGRGSIPRTGVQLSMFQQMLAKMLKTTLNEQKENHYFKLLFEFLLLYAFQSLV